MKETSRERREGLNQVRGLSGKLWTGSEHPSGGCRGRSTPMESLDPLTYANLRPWKGSEFVSDLIECLEKLYRTTEDGWISRRSSQTSARGCYGRYPLDGAILGTCTTTKHKSLLLWDEGRGKLVELWGASKAGNETSGPCQEWYPLLLHEEIDDATEAMVFDLIAGKLKGSVMAKMTYRGKLLTSISCLTLSRQDLHTADLESWGGPRPLLDSLDVLTLSPWIWKVTLQEIRVRISQCLSKFNNTPLMSCAHGLAKRLTQELKNRTDPSIRLMASTGGREVRTEEPTNRIPRLGPPVIDMTQAGLAEPRDGNTILEISGLCPTATMHSLSRSVPRTSETRCH